MRQIARELGVRYLLEGSVRKAGNRVRITGELINSTNGAHIWGDHFDGTLEDIFELQDQVASAVVGVIEPRLRLCRNRARRAASRPRASTPMTSTFARWRRRSSGRAKVSPSRSGWRRMPSTSMPPMARPWRGLP